MRVEVRSLVTDAEELESEQAIVIKAIDGYGRTTSATLRAGQAADVRVVAGCGVVLEAASIAEPIEGAVILGDELRITDGAA